MIDGLNTNYRATNIVIIDAIPRNRDDLQTADRLEDDLKSVVDSEGSCRAYRKRINSKIELLVFFDELTRMCRDEGLEPLLHIESHGSDDGLTIGDNDDPISWAELMPHFKQLNKASKNKLGLFIASCHGFSLAKHLNLDAGSPFNFLIAPQGEVSMGELDDSMTPFYRSLFNGNSDSFKISFDLLPIEFKKLFVEQEFFKYWVCFINTQIKPLESKRNRTRYVEGLVTEALPLKQFSGLSLKETRKTLKDQIDPSNLTQYLKSIFEDRKSRLLYGCGSVTYEQIELVAANRQPVVNL
jgi:hypothetical protein